LGCLPRRGPGFGGRFRHRWGCAPDSPFRGWRQDRPQGGRLAGRAIAGPGLGGGLQRELAVPKEGSKFGERFGDFLDEGHDHRDQPRREPPVGAIRLDGFAEPEAELLQFLGWGWGRGGHGDVLSLLTILGKC
jgi:hypothetical protein